jgi:hypothetical protein
LISGFNLEGAGNRPAEISPVNNPHIIASME